MNVISRNSDSIQFSESEPYSKTVKLHFHFHQSSQQGFRIYKRMRNEQTFPNTDFQSLFVESPHVVPEVLLQQRGHLILQHLFFLLPEDSSPSDQIILVTLTEQNNEKSKSISKKFSLSFREERFEILFIEQQYQFSDRKREREREIRGFDATSTVSPSRSSFFFLTYLFFFLPGRHVSLNIKKLEDSITTRSVCGDPNAMRFRHVIFRLA